MLLSLLRLRASTQRDFNVDIFKLLFAQILCAMRIWRCAVDSASLAFHRFTKRTQNFHNHNSAINDYDSLDKRPNRVVSISDIINLIWAAHIELTIAFWYIKATPPACKHLTRSRNSLPHFVRLMICSFAPQTTTPKTLRTEAITMCVQFNKEEKAMI